VNCCQCQGIEDFFSQRAAAADLKRYRRKGAAKTTRYLLDWLLEAGVEGLTLLDIGGGVGAIQHALLQAGARRATHVDASAAYLRASQQEAARQGHADRVTYHHGDFVTLAPHLPPADIVTLDKVICCYHDMPSLVTRSAALATQFYAAVYPLDVWWVKIGMRFINLYLQLRGSPFRVFAHSTAAVEALLQKAGFVRRARKTSFGWQAVIYRRVSGEASPAT